MRPISLTMLHPQDITPTEHMRHLALRHVCLILNGQDGQPHAVPPQQTHHVADTSQHTEHISALVRQHFLRHAHTRTSEIL